MEKNSKEVESISKKELRHKILEQMEFYFSDSNLTKDRFLKQEITNSQDGFIDLKVFLKFNKIRDLTTDLKNIIKAVKKSELLELNENETLVRRKTPFVELTQKDIDKKTIYVENLPSKIDNQKIRKQFEEFGKVTYISLPKFKTTNQLKGFAFIEYDQKSDAKKAIEFFKEQTEEHNQEPIGKFPKFNAQIIELEKKIKKAEDEIKILDPPKEELETKPDQDSNKRKSTNDESNNYNKKDQSSDIKKEKLNEQEWLKNLRVVSKKNWLKSKDQFLENQKQEVNSLKEKLNSLNKHLDDLKNDILKQKANKIKTDDIIRGCILKITLNLNNENEFEMTKLTRQQFKEKYLKEFNDQIAYVDIEKNSNKILIRCKTPEAAQSLVSNQIFFQDCKKNILSGDEETDYFEKIYSNRNKKQEKKENKQNKPNKNEFKQEKVQAVKPKELSNPKLTEKKVVPKHEKFDQNDD